MSADIVIISSPPCRILPIPSSSFQLYVQAKNEMRLFVVVWGDFVVVVLLFLCHSWGEHSTIIPLQLNSSHNFVMNILIAVNDMTRMSRSVGWSGKLWAGGYTWSGWDRMSILSYKLFIVNLIDICKLVNFVQLQFTIHCHRLHCML